MELAKNTHNMTHTTAATQPDKQPIYNVKLLLTFNRIDEKHMQRRRALAH